MLFDVTQVLFEPLPASLLGGFRGLEIISFMIGFVEVVRHEPVKPPLSILSEANRKRKLGMDFDFNRFWHERLNVSLSIGRSITAIGIRPKIGHEDALVANYRACGIIVPFIGCSLFLGVWWHRYLFHTDVLIVKPILTAFTLSW